MYKLSHSIKMFTLTSLFTALFLGGIGTGIILVDGIIVFALSVVITVLTVSCPCNYRTSQDRAGFQVLLDRCFPALR